MIQIFNDYPLFNLNDEAPIFWPPDAKSQLIGKDPDDEKD